MKLHIWLLAASLAFAAGCGGGGGNSSDPEDEEEAEGDAAPGPPATPIACSGSAQCAGQRFARVCRSGACAECLSDTDCAIATALGPSCDGAMGYCVCSDDASCAGNPNGGTCHLVVRACTCIRDSDCPPGQQCSLLPYLGTDVRSCQTP